MKKTKTFLVLLMLTAGPAIAQPTLTAASNGLQAAFTEQYYYNNFSTPALTAGAAGASQLWDFSSFSATRNTTNTFGACSSTPYCGSFPGATLAEDDSLAYGATTQKEYIYYQSSSSMLAIIGHHGSFTAVYSHPEVLLTFPFTYLSQVVSAFSYPDPNVAGSAAVGIDSVLADGWGTLKTPAGTFVNVLRVKTVRTWYDSTASGLVQNEKDYFYRWYSPQYRDYLFNIEDYEVFGGTGYMMGYTVQPVLAVPHITGEERSLSIVPNPATGAAHLCFISTSQQPAEVVLSDMTGRTIFHMTILCKAGRNDAAVDLTGVPAGMYVLRLNAGDERAMGKLLVR